jgi:hypothetical protein
MLAFVVFIQSFHSFLSLHFFTHTTQPTPHKSCHSINRFIAFSLIHSWGHLSFHPSIHAFAAQFSFASLSFTAPHKSPLSVIRFIPFSLLLSLQPLSFPPTAKAKNPPALP